MSFFRTPFDKNFTGKPKRWSQSHSRTSSSESHSQLLQHGPETPPTTNLNLRIQMCRVSRFLRCPLSEKKTKLSTLLINHNSRYSSLSCLHWWLKSVNLVDTCYLPWFFPDSKDFVFWYENALWKVYHGHLRFGSWAAIFMLCFKASDRHGV